MSKTGIPKGPNDASTELPWHIVESENMVKVFDANRGYVTQFDLRKFLGAECIEKRMKKARLIADAPAAKLALDLICAGVMRMCAKSGEDGACLIFGGVGPSDVGGYIYEVRDTWTDTINAIGWTRAREALAAARGVQ